MHSTEVVFWIAKDSPGKDGTWLALQGQVRLGTTRKGIACQAEVVEAGATYKAEDQLAMIFRLRKMLQLQSYGPEVFEEQDLAANWALASLLEGARGQGGQGGALVANGAKKANHMTTGRCANHLRLT
mmetsp:Transcript_43358/g.101248  ORF Transcript_43358/g.101248 Transcript_43358/m.101248 type:complete len:128 (+) Transcript_43358:1030-1413(+)